MKIVSEKEEPDNLLTKLYARGQMTFHAQEIQLLWFFILRDTF